MVSVQTFNQKALTKSEIKPFTLVYNKRGTRVWKSENGLQIKAVKIGSNEYYDVSIIRGARLGELNFKGQKISAKEAQSKVSAFATQFNFNYIKNPVKLIKESEAGQKLYNAWRNLQKEFTTK